MRRSEDEKYELDPDDGLLRELVGEWVQDKHAHIRNYIGSARRARAKWIGGKKPGATYIELYSGPGRARIRDTAKVIDGSAIAAWKETTAYGAPFTQIFIADRRADLLSACKQRLARLNAPVSSFCGEAATVIDEIVAKMHTRALHCVLLDPYNLESLDFSIISKLAAFKRMDIIVHLSIGDGTRNAAEYVDQNSPLLEKFAPGWQAYIDRNRGKQTITQQLFQHWVEKVSAAGFKVSSNVDKIRNSQKSLMYWLVHLSKHSLPETLWKKTGDDPQFQLSL